MKLKSLLVLAFTLVLASCATTNNPNAFQDVPSNQPHATLSTSIGGLMLHSFTFVKSIDGKEASARSFYIKPGSHTLRVVLEQEHFNSENSVELTLQFTAQNGQYYSIKMQEDGDRISGWVVDSSGRAVSNKVSAESGPAHSQAVQVNDLPH